MQHLDEGTIHSWLDGALSEEESKRVEAHVAECASCANAVAEARGFIAASSRILTALDNAPRGVLPAQAPVRRYNAVMWKAAAAVLVVAAGSFAIRGTLSPRIDRKSTSALEGVTADSALHTPPVEASKTAATAEVAPPRTAVAEPSVRRADSRLGGSSTIAQPRGAISPQSAQRQVADADLQKKAEAQSLSQPTGKATGNVSAADAAPVVAATELAATGAACVDCARPLLRVVSVDSSGPERRTTYEVAPNQIVTLTENDAPVLRIRGAESAAGAAQIASKQPAAASSPSMDSRRAAPSRPLSVPTPSAPPPPPAFADQINTVIWTDSTTHKLLKLSGRMPVAQLEQLQRRIQLEREARKKTP